MKVLRVHRANTFLVDGKTNQAMENNPIGMHNIPYIKFVSNLTSKE